MQDRGMGNFLSRFDSWSGRASTVATFWPMLVPAGVGAVILGYLSMSVGWINKYGAFGWATTGLLAFVLISAGLALVGYGRHRWEMAKASRKWATDVDAINPLDNEFHKKRIKLADLRHPVRRQIEGKKFTDCQLMGPTNLFLSHNMNLTNAAFLNCDLILTKNKAQIFNVTELTNCEIIGGEIVEATIYVHPSVFQSFKDMPGVRFVNQTEDVEVDARQPL